VVEKDLALLAVDLAHDRAARSVDDSYQQLVLARADVEGAAGGEHGGALLGHSPPGCQNRER